MGISRVDKREALPTELRYNKGMQNQFDVFKEKVIAWMRVDFENNHVDGTIQTNEGQLTWEQWYASIQVVIDWEMLGSWYAQYIGEDNLEGFGWFLNEVDSEDWDYIQG